MCVGEKWESKMKRCRVRVYYIKRVRLRERERERVEEERDERLIGAAPVNLAWRIEPSLFG